MSRLQNLIRELAILQGDIEQLESRLNKMRSKAAMLATVDIPEAMTEVGSATFITDDHYKCEVSFKIYGSLPSRETPDARHAAIEYLKAHDAAELIKSTVEISFAKGDIKSANRTRRFIEAAIAAHTIRAEHEPVVETDNFVHPMSLQAWGRARVKANEPIDLAAVGLRGQTMAVVKRTEPK